MDNKDFEKLIEDAVEEYFKNYLKNEEDIKEKNANILFKDYDEKNSFKNFKKTLKKTKNKWCFIPLYFSLFIFYL